MTLKGFQVTILAQLEKFIPCLLNPLGRFVNISLSPMKDSTRKMAESRFIKMGILCVSDCVTMACCCSCGG